MPSQGDALKLVWRLLVDMRPAFTFHTGMLVVQEHGLWLVHVLRHVQRPNTSITRADVIDWFLHELVYGNALACLVLSCLRRPRVFLGG